MMTFQNLVKVKFNNKIYFFKIIGSLKEDYELMDNLLIGLEKSMISFENSRTQASSESILRENKLKNELKVKDQELREKEEKLKLFETFFILLVILLLGVGLSFIFKKLNSYTSLFH